MMKIALWQAILLIRTPLQMLLKVLMGLQLAAGVAGAVMIFTGYGVDAVDRLPFVYRLMAPVLMAGVFVVLSALSFYLDSLVFHLTPRNRLLFLWG
ncbi:hypothetical protein PhaeoP23_03722 (plasmid) [Phaeobacter piscinae]|uniref:ABC transporter permease n=1 Tax=Phaeobacter piscinae TaxID=1580596 RepID=A0ABM6PJ88_9RHOB|nr:hypothetical protein [Phaeobacter piscinae]ATG37799.1 hypothetical protein PhaeoP36_03722 [Phaeobacter piscinae]AUQ88320.1 hypothetical protein PhaeoP42_03723 [Phaeobacter piscinae]AUR26203.1 hypothetical protein PhaeoP23_03722 [Phaeobacter piscinae]